MVIDAVEPPLKLLLVNRFSPLSAVGSAPSQASALALRLGARETAVKPYVLLLLVLTIAVYADFFVKWNRGAG